MILYSNTEGFAVETSSGKVFQLYFYSDNYYYYREKEHMWVVCSFDGKELEPLFSVKYFFQAGYHINNRFYPEKNTHKEKWYGESFDIMTDLSLN